MFNQKGQNIAEYAILITFVIAAVVTIQTYVKRGVQGRIKDEVVDMATKTSELGSTGQYEPYYLDSSYTTETKKDTKTKTGAAKSPTIGVDSEVERSGKQTLLAPPSTKSE